MPLGVRVISEFTENLWHRIQSIWVYVWPAFARVMQSGLNTDGVLRARSKWLCWPPHTRGYHYDRPNLDPFCFLWSNVCAPFMHSIHWLSAVDSFYAKVNWSHWIEKQDISCLHKHNQKNSLAYLVLDDTAKMRKITAMMAVHTWRQNQQQNISSHREFTTAQHILNRSAFVTRSALRTHFQFGQTEFEISLHYTY